MTRLAVALAIALLSACAPSPAAPEPPKPVEPPKRTEQELREAKEKKVRRLMELSGVAQASRQMIKDMLAAAAESDQFPPSFLKKFKELADPNELFELAVPIYMKHLDEKELDAAIAFYQTPEGARFAKALPSINSDSAKAGALWSQDVAMKIIQSIEDEPDPEEEGEDDDKDDEAPLEEH